MRFFEFKPLKPLTPQQARIAALKRNAENARMALKRERDNQQKISLIKKLHDVTNKSYL
jgi:hypothetical protein